MAKVLVVGGAGYVGSAACAWLIDHGHEIAVVDDLSNGRLELVPERLRRGGRFMHSRAGERAVIEPLLAAGAFDCVMHFAAHSLVGESVEKPDEYFENNVLQTRALLEAMAGAGVRRFIFSSTCAIFGDPGDHPISEGQPKKPVNPYGETKLEVERMMEAFAASHGLQGIALRYFNAAGAESKLRVGEWHEPETHLIPRVLRAAAAGTPVEIFGADYPTPDGTCVRDYIHVNDLAAAHEAAMQRLLARGPGGVFEAFNLGSEKGFSVREVVRACEKAVGKPLRAIERPRRPGDPPRLVADSALARRELGFGAGGLKSLDVIVESAWQWEQKRSKLRLRAVFLDRDGTLNEDPGYLSEPSQLKLLPGVGRALALLKGAGFRLVVVSNQSGVGRGLIDPKVLPQIHAHLDELLRHWPVSIDRYELCLHKPEDRCDCRKPSPKLLLDAARAEGIDLTRSYMIGDKHSDLKAGQAAGCAASVLVRTGEGAEAEKLLKPGEADFIAGSLLEAASWVLDRDSGSAGS